MGTNSKIEWCHHTQNFWIGCTKCSLGCANCYAEDMMDTRYKRVSWGKGQERALTSDANWLKPLSWDAAARKAGACINPLLRNGEGDAGLRPRVFASSLSDVFDEEVPDEWRDRMFAVIHATPYLDWLLLTKRPEKALCYMTKERESHIIDARNSMAGGPLDAIYKRSLQYGISHFPNWHNIWMGTSVENQKAADERIPTLLQIPAQIRFLSCEPLLGPVDLKLNRNGHSLTRTIGEDLHWVIGGGESGPKARPCHPNDARSLRDQCVKARVPFFWKQWGEWEGGDKVPLDYQKGASQFQEGKYHDFGDDYMALKVGKKSAGRLLDGVEWNQFPEVARR